MIFIATLISLLIERFFHWGHLRQWRWFSIYQNKLNTKIGQLNPAIRLAIYVLPFVLVVGIISRVLTGWSYDIFHLVFATIVLLYCLGPGNLWAQAYQCLSELNKDDPRHAPEFAQTAFGIPLPENSQAFHQALLRVLFVAANQRIFAVIFWFAILGPMGAVLYRMVELCGSSPTSTVADFAIKTKKVLDWLPVRIFTFIFALTGHFSKVFARWKSGIQQGIDANDLVLVECGTAALDVVKDNRVPEDGSAEKEALLLFDRTLVLALVILAVIVLLV